jgi:DNA modification methylase
MIKHFENFGTLYNGHVLEIAKQLPNESVDCVITSPPYWQLRDYGHPEQWGLEPTYQEYLAHLQSLMKEIWRVLKPNGTVWVNLGDSYNSGGNNDAHKEDKTHLNKKHYGTCKVDKKIQGIQPKSLMLIPHRFAINCIDNGWIVRNDIIWAKPNGMPESVTDRFSKKHEYMFFMVKSQKYYFDLDSVREKHSENSGWAKQRANGINTWEYATKAKTEGLNGMETSNNPLGKNCGSVSDFWEIPTVPSSKNHYATFNDRLIRKPILAGCPIGGVIYDPFMGSGTTAIAAIHYDRQFIGSEINETYYQDSLKAVKQAIEIKNSKPLLIK